MLVNSLLIQSVYPRRLGGSAGGNDFFGDNVDGCSVASREKKLGPLTRKGTRDGAADPASRSVDHRNLVLEHHSLSHFFVRWHPFLGIRSSGAKRCGSRKHQVERVTLATQLMVRPSTAP